MSKQMRVKINKNGDYMCVYVWLLLMIIMRKYLNQNKLLSKFAIHYRRVIYVRNKHHDNNKDREREWS